MTTQKARKNRMKVVIMAGGKGTRISSLRNDIPKPMIPIMDKPVLEYEITQLKKQGFKDFIITIGYLGQSIKEYFGDGTALGVHIEYFFEKTPMGNAGALFKLKDKLVDDFLLLNGDSIFCIDFNRFLKFHKNKGGLATLFAHPNSHPYDSGLLLINDNGSVIKWLAKEEERPKWYKNLVNAGVHVISPKLLDCEPQSEIVDLDRQLLKPLCGSGKMFAYCSPEYIKDMGTPQRYESVINDIKKGIVRNKSLLFKQKAIFLDRDGTINKQVGFLKNIDDFELLDGVAEAIKKINDSGYLAIVISNQPVIARGEMTIEELNMVHNKMETLLGQQGAFLDAIYYCPHHPDKGFVGERIEYKIDCSCRKPKPGLLIKASEDFNIDLSESWMIGDSNLDVLAGKNAGCKTILLSTIKDDNIQKTKTCKNLLNAVDAILEDLYER